MRNGFVLTRIAVTLGMLLATNVSLWAQEALPAEASSQETAPPAKALPPTNERAATVAGRVVGAVSFETAEALAVLLLPGWSETLSANIAAGMTPMIPLDAGAVKRIAAAQLDAGNSTLQTGDFEFRNIPAGEYQVVAVKIKDGSPAGAAIAAGNRVIVEGRDIGDLELEIRALPSDQPSKRPGGAKNRETAVLDSINNPIVEVVPPSTIQPTRPWPSPSSPPPGSNGSRKKEIIEQILVGIGMVGAMVAFSLW